MHSETGIPDSQKPLEARRSAIGKLAILAVVAIVAWTIAVADYLPIWGK